YLVEHAAIRTEQLDFKCHLPDSMGRTTQAWIIGADHSFHAIQHSVGEFVALNVALRDLQHTAIHRKIVLSGGDDQICPANQALLVNFVMMKQSAAGGFSCAYPFESIWTRDGTNML